MTGLLASNLTVESLLYLGFSAIQNHVLREAEDEAQESTQRYRRENDEDTDLAVTDQRKFYLSEGFRGNTVGGEDG